MTTVSRRSFLQAGGILGGAALAGTLAAVAPVNVTEALAEPEEAATEAAADPFAKPAPIDESEITAVEEADIVIVGIGTAGLTCAVKAAQGGASVIMLAKDAEPSSQGGSNFAINSRLTRELGVELDVEAALRHSMLTQGYRVSEGQWAIFAKESGRGMDWLMDLVEPYGIGTTLEVPELWKSRQ